MSVAELLRQLEARLPELEWKMGKLGQALPTNHLPKGLFRLPAEASPSAFILEIKADLKKLTRYQSERSGYYLAQKIQQKITVLVSLCRLHISEPASEKRHYVDMICTRQRFLQDLEAEMHTLSAQYEAISAQLNQSNHNPEVVLALKGELGEIEKRLTLAKEAFSRATKW
ncbi:coiled-coil protein [Legionella lansingensis]|uniref:Coiled-coil protein n=1 Tax=Legionella lansingensis TaxID=45067 RepID=A0A0W0VRF2_9GAMM|nr:hypothetical protein [Legionella lansingensis]KTD22702.1 coiled-coil protein [Legionella lansingensis]SNV55438.1 coiled-coil protein [Legionella lansingensis]